MKELQFDSTRDVEDLVISGLYKEIFRGKLDAAEQHLVIDRAIGRDVRPEELDNLVSTKF